MKAYMKEYENWLTNPVFDEETRKEVAAMKDEKQIEDAFYKQLSFGTGGLRGIIGAGTNRMNIYTVGKASQGLANFINTKREKRQRGYRVRQPAYVAGICQSIRADFCGERHQGVSFRFAPSHARTCLSPCANCTLRRA